MITPAPQASPSGGRRFEGGRPLQVVPKESLRSGLYAYRDGPCPACGGTTWRLRETPSSDGQWLWACAACADRLQAYLAQEQEVTVAAPPELSDQDLAGESDYDDGGDEWEFI